MPLSEILDRYTITKLKSERTSEDVSDELRTYKKEIENPDYVAKLNKIVSFIDRLYEINGELWDTEGGIRKGIDMPLEEIGRLALKVRDLNCTRNEIKAEIVDTFFGNGVSVIVKKNKPRIVNTIHRSGHCIQ